MPLLVYFRLKEYSEYREYAVNNKKKRCFGFYFYLKLSRMTNIYSLKEQKSVGVLKVFETFTTHSSS
jgi:hypothetical protein